MVAVIVLANSSVPVGQDCWTPGDDLGWLRALLRHVKVIQSKFELITDEQFLLWCKHGRNNEYLLWCKHGRNNEYWYVNNEFEDEDGGRWIPNRLKDSGRIDETWYLR